MPYTVQAQARPEQALIIKKHWCERIFYHNKTWEIRPTMTRKRTRICVAEASARCLVGEVCISDCILVALRAEDGSLHPPDNSEHGREVFLLRPENTQKHHITDISMLKPYDKYYAWVLKDIRAYHTPVPWLQPHGAQVFVDLRGRVPSDNKTASWLFCSSSKLTQRLASGLGSR